MSYEEHICVENTLMPMDSQEGKGSYPEYAGMSLVRHVTSLC